MPLEPSRVQVRREADGLHLMLPKRRRAVEYLTAAWTLVVVGLGLTLMLTGEGDEDPGWFLAVWALLGLAFFGLSLWGLLHREEIVLDARALKVGWGVGGWYRWRSYTRDGIEDVRMSAETMSSLDPRAGLRQYGIGGGIVAFDYGARTVRFGKVEEAEAKRVVAALGAEGLPTR